MTKGNIGSMLRRHQRASRGQLMPLMAIPITVVLASAALAVDLGYWRFEKRLEQTAADSAAIAGAIEYSYSADVAKATTAARTAASSNGFTHDGVSVTVSVNYPPAAGAYAGNKNALETIINKPQSSFFALILGQSSQLVGSRAVALLSSGGRDCIYALNPTGSSMTMNGATMTAPQCGVVSNGNLTINGSSVTTGSLTYAGSATVNGSTLNQPPQQTIPATDPCQTVPGCRYLTSTPPMPGVCLPSSFHGTGITIQPGTYCSTLVVHGSSGVTFAPGLYILEQGMSFNGSSNISGTGVTFYITNGSVAFNGTPVNFSAPTTGPTAGVLFYQVATDTSSFPYNGSGGGLAGMIYVPSGQVVLNGSMTQWLLVVGNTVTLNGSGVNVGSSAFAVFTHVVLAE